MTRAFGRAKMRGVALCAAACMLCTLTARGDFEIVEQSAVVAVGGAIGGDEVRKITNSDGTVDIVHIFTTAAAAAEFSIPSENLINATTYRVLAVGGGGSGGSDCGGGGGAGGYIHGEGNAYGFASGQTYSIVVGAGGASVGSSAGWQLRGNNGSATTITNATSGVEVLMALGGGGGGTSGNTVGLAGASGGGGTNNGAGGAGTAGQGGAGGKGAGNYTGAGGGGAGGAAANAVSGTGGNGGAGVSNNITGEDVLYAFGGGGRGANSAGVSGDGISNDGYGESGVTSATGKPGKPNTGAGGGGGGTNNSRISGAGGSGIVAIRYKLRASGDGVSGSEVVTDGGATTNALLTFTGTASESSFYIPYGVKARILAVGGGGGGANPGRTGTSYGGAGGGGAGGMIDDVFYIGPGTYTVKVGAGAPARTGTSVSIGADGGPSYVVIGSTTNLYAYGGGGGGIGSSDANAVGREGGSGGGGSYRSSAKDGGAALQASSEWGGWGYPGGNGTVTQSGAGGGGAGGAGYDASVADAGARGGAGRPSDITGSEVWYAMGGGGGAHSGTGGAGGEGVGDSYDDNGRPYGSGASGSLAAAAGKPGTGSGGGGGSNASRSGGAGGSGIVIIRILDELQGALEKPAADLGSIPADGTMHTPYTENLAYFEIDGDIEESEVGEYSFTLKPRGTLKWSDGTQDAFTCTWRIVAAPLVIDSFTVTGWQAGEIPSSPAVSSSSHALADGWYYYQVRKAGTTKWTRPENGWLEWAKGLDAGAYQVRVVFTENAAYSLSADEGWEEIADGAWTPANGTADFTVRDIVVDGVTFPSYLGYHAIVDITPPDGADLENFPMLVRISASSPAGMYRQAKADGSDIRFTLPNAPDTPLPSEVETWNTSGESFVWVKVPRYAAGERIVMSWGELATLDEEGNEIAMAIPAVNPVDVWSGYTGVWHMSENIGASAAATTLSADSTDNGYDGVPFHATTQGDETYCAGMVSTAGAIGNGRVISSQKQLGTHLRLAGTQAVELGGKFVVSGWINASDIQASNGIISRKHHATNAWTGDLSGFEVSFWGTSGAGPRSFAIMGGNGTAKQFATAKPFKDLGWTHIAIVYDSTGDTPLATVYINGQTHEGYSQEINTAPTDNAKELMLGGNPDNNTSHPSFCGALDEWRVSTVESATTPEWIAADYAQAAGACTIGDVYVNYEARFMNRWFIEPSVSPVEFKAGEEATLSAGEGASGSAGVSIEIWKMDGEPVKLDATGLDGLEPGQYKVVFKIPSSGDAEESGTGTRTWTALETEIYITIREDLTVTALGDATQATLKGRVLLANDDSGTAQPISWQNYTATANAYTRWIAEGEIAASATYPYLYTNRVSTLTSLSPVEELCGGTNIWYLQNVFVGHTVLRTGFAADQNFLPHSRSGDRLGTVDGAAIGASLAMLNRGETNTQNAVAIYSPCYTNGIGTIYFDAVNGWTNHAAADGTEYNRIVVEVLTESRYGKVPVDDEVDDGSVRFGNVRDARWTKVGMTALKIVDGALAETIVTNELALAIETGGDKSFYRVIVNGDGVLNTREPCRFRIRRVASAPVFAEANAGFILVDNIEVSYPAMRADLKPLGRFDAEKRGAQIVGWGGAFSPAFPSATAKAVYGRMEAEYTTNPMVQVANGGTNFIASAALYYRWRYLSQRIGEWKSVPLVRGTSDYFTTQAALELPAEPGDVEFYSRISLAAPYYQYCDYSGLGIGTPDWTEEIASVENSCVADETPATHSAAKNMSRGDHWFARLRDGASDWEQIGVEIIDASGATNTHWAALSGDHRWRAFYRAPTNGTEKISFRIVGRNFQETGARDWATNETFFAIDSAEYTDGGLMSGTYSEGETWQALEIDDITGYALFQIDDSARSIVVVHADYQNFNAWTDAQNSNFISAFLSGDETNRTGVAASKQTFTSLFGTWKTMSDTNTNYWRETFSSLTEATAGEMKFNTELLTFNGWKGRNAKYVPESYTTVKTGSLYNYALQIRGNGLGALEYSAGAIKPRGLGTLTFSARLASSLEDDGLAFCDTDGMTSLSNYTFNASFRASTNATSAANGFVAAVAANYRDNKGWYEMRFVQTSAAAAVLELWKHKKVSGMKGMQSYFLGASTNTGIFATLADTSGAKYSASKYARLAISVTNLTATSVKVTGLVGTEAVDFGGLGATGATNAKCAIVEFTDTGSDEYGGAALMKGTFGVNIANCPGEFIGPRYIARPLVAPNPSAAAGTKAPGSASAFKVYSAAQDVSFPGNVDWKNAMNTLTGDSTDYEEWSVPAGYWDTVNVQNRWNGLMALAPAQTLGVYVASEGKTTFGTTAASALASVSVNSFSVVTNTVPLRLNDGDAVQIRVIEDDNPSEVVIDDASFSEWRGADWEELDSSVIANKPSRFANEFAYTNYTFTSCWVKDKALLMSARRTATNGVCSIVSPLMDGYQYANGYVSGIGLGQIYFEYKDADKNAKLLVQALTAASKQSGAYADAWAAADSAAWTTIDTIDFSTMTEDERVSGAVSRYLGMHGVIGLMRIVVPKDLVAAVQDEEDEDNFGDVTITKVETRDEPEVDGRSWHGWNVRTLGDTADSEGRMLLADFTESPTGLSLALNNSLESDTYAENAAEYRQHLPYVQTPEFGSDAVGAITFKARRYDTSTGSAAAYITLYGKKAGQAAEKWHWMRDFKVVSNSYSNFSYTTTSSETYSAFRIAVRLAEETADADSYDNSDAAENALWTGENPVRVLVEEVAVTEAIRPRVGFRNVGAFRSDMNGEEAVPGVPGAAEQPLCNEVWGVQCEIYKAQLAEKIDFETVAPRVYLHWYAGTEPWGAENWMAAEGAHLSNELMRVETEDGRFVFRSSYKWSPNSVVPLSTIPGSVVQYRLEVVYNQLNDQKQIITGSDSLKALDWSTPSWYRPVDLNEGKDGFSAYTILDSVAPNWAWINEVNIFGEEDARTYENHDADCQFIEIAAPVSADLSGWYVEALEADGASIIHTNRVATFGQDGISGIKVANVASNMSFRVIASPLSQPAWSDKLAGAYEFDGIWNFTGVTNYNSSTYLKSGEIMPYSAVALRLVRPSGIVEHEIVAMGTNLWAGVDYYEDVYSGRLAATNLNAISAGRADFIYIGDDDDSSNSFSNSLGVVEVAGGDYSCWTNGVFNTWTNACVRTPGRINAGQIIHGNAPDPLGGGMILLGKVEGNHVRIFDEAGVPHAAGDDIALYVQQGVATNLYYETDPWFAVTGATWRLTTGGKTYFSPSSLEADGRWRVTVGGEAISNSIEVVAAAAPDAEAARYLDGNRYDEAVMEWLTDGQSLYGDEWPAATNIYLANFRLLGSSETAPLTLTEMYWLDIPPTVSNLWLVGGITNWEHVVRTIDGVENDHRTIHAKLYITNENDSVAVKIGGIERAAWAPYALRGVVPGTDSRGYSGAWPGATFKVKGKLRSLFGTPRDLYWVTIRKFTFDENSFDEGFVSKIELSDPRKSASNPGYKQWSEHFAEHPDDNPFYLWRLDDSTGISPAVERLAAENFYTYLDDNAAEEGE